MNIKYKPNSTLGTWSVRLIAASILFFILFFIIVSSGQESGDTFFSNLTLSIPMLIAAILAVSSFFTGIIGIIKNRERAVFVYLSTAIGFFVLLFGLGEIISPH